MAVDKFIMGTYETLTAREQAAQLNLTYSHVVWRRMQLVKRGVLSSSKKAYHPPWSEHDCEALRDNYGLLSLRVLSRRLNRSPVAIRLKAKRLRVAMKDNHYSLRQISEIFGIDSKTMFHIVKEGWLKGRKAGYRQGPHKVWNFQEADVVAFIKRYPWTIRVEKLRDCHYFCHLLRQEWERDPWLSRAEAAAVVGVNPDTMSRAVKHGLVKAYCRSPGSKWSFLWFRKSSLEGLKVKIRARHIENMKGSKKGGDRHGKGEKPAAAYVRRGGARASAAKGQGY